MHSECLTEITEDFHMNITVKDEEDIAVLVESLKTYHTLDPYIRKEAFSALRTLLLHNKTTQDFFRGLQGVELMISIYQDSREDKVKDVMENALFTLGVAVERNDVSRNALLTPELFKLVKGAMKRKSTSSLTSAFLLLCLVSNNGDGQCLARTTRCIHKLCELLKEAITDKDDTEQSSKICNAICSTLCATNIDPINETNQELCCGLIMPSVVRWLYTDIGRQSLQSLLNLIGSCVNGNSKTQTHLRVIGGVRAMVALLDGCSSVDALQNTEDTCLLTQLTNTLSCSYVSHVANQFHAIELGVVEILLACLQVNVSERMYVQLQMNCVTALVSLLDSDDNELGKQKFQDNGGVSVLIEIMATTQNEKLKTLATFLLHKTYNNEGLRNQLSSNSLSENVDCPTSDSHDSTIEETHKNTLERDEIHTITDTASDLHDKQIVANQNTAITTEERDDKILSINNGHEKETEICNCRNALVVDSCTVLKVLLVNSDICEYHKAIGQAIERYITKKRQLAASKE